MDYAMEIAHALDDNGYNEGRLSEDNTYNWSWLGPWNINFFTIELNNEYVTFFEVHQGGDARSNYSQPYVFSDSYENEFLEQLFQVFASIEIQFKDGGSVIARSQQDSDIWYFEVEEDRRSEDAEAFEEFCEEMGQGSELDDFLTDLIKR